MAGMTSAALAVGLSAYQISQAEKAKKSAKNSLNSYERQSLDNAFENVSISTMGSDLIKEENQRASAGFVDTLQNTGTRGILGGIPKVVASMNDANMRAAKLLDDQVINREYAIAGDNARIEGIRENRDNNNIAALSSQYNAGKQDAMNGYMGLASGVAMGARDVERNQTAKTTIANPDYQAFDSGLNYNQPQPYPAPYFSIAPQYAPPQVQENSNPFANMKTPFYF